jgi:hypothetical protein
MGLDLWHRDDVARILASTHETMRRSLDSVAPLDPGAAQTYRQGFGDALQAVALAFGLLVTDPVFRTTEVLEGGVRRAANRNRTNWEDRP